MNPGNPKGRPNQGAPFVGKHESCVYIMTNKQNGTLTWAPDLVKRVWEHKSGAAEGFTKRHGLHRLVWYQHDTMETAINRLEALEAKLEDPADRRNKLRSGWTSTKSSNPPPHRPATSVALDSCLRRNCLWRATHGDENGGTPSP